MNRRLSDFVLPGLSLVVLALFVFSRPVLAHHSFAAEFEDKNGEINGVVTEARYTNPHPRYRVQVTNADGSTEEWELQGQSVTNMRATGWDRDFVKIGDQVRVWGSLGRDESKRLFIRGLEKSTGEVYPVVSKDRPANRAQTVNATVGKNYAYAKLNPDAPIDISGPWRNSYKFHVTVDDLEPKPTPFTPAAKARYEATVHHDDYSLRCVAPGLPRIFGAPYDMEIVDAGSHYLFVYIEHNTPRWIYMDGRSVPENFPDTSMGFSLGHWEGEELVIETTRLLPGWLDGSGMPFEGGEDTHIVERYTFAEDRLSMERVMTIHDANYTQPLVRRRASARDDYLVIAEHDSCDPSSYYRDLLEAGEIEQRLEAY
ncbi:MAG: DUF6152 family protein [Pseudomonadales bacterium]|nr:DUF6152 family protein [Pseudomonadales bacterium]